MLWSDAKWRIERESVFPITCTRQIGDELPDENASLPLWSLYKLSGQEDFEMGFNWVRLSCNSLYCRLIQSGLVAHLKWISSSGIYYNSIL
jgi:hypothetical protein